MTRSAAAESPAATLAGDAARLWQMMEAGHPVLKTQAGRVMKQLGSTEIGDEAAFTSFVGRNKQLLHQLDLEWKRAGNSEKVGGRAAYLCWKGNQAIHRSDGTSAHTLHPQDYEVGDIHRLRVFIETHRLAVRAALLDCFGKQRKGKARREWETVVLPELLPPAAKGEPAGMYYETLCHELSGVPPLEGVGYGVRKAGWALERLRALGSAGALDLNRITHCASGDADAAIAGVARRSKAVATPPPTTTKKRNRSPAASPPHSSERSDDRTDLDGCDVDEGSDSGRAEKSHKSSVSAAEVSRSKLIEEVSRSNLPGDIKKHLVSELTETGTSSDRLARQVQADTIRKVMRALRGDLDSRYAAKQRFLRAKVRSLWPL